MVPNPTMNGLGLLVYTWSSPTCVVDQVTKRLLFLLSILMLLGLFMNLTNMDDGVMVVGVWDGVFFHVTCSGQATCIALGKVLKQIWVQFPIATYFQNVYMLM